MNKLEKTEHGITIYSIEEDKWIEVSQAQINAAEHYHQQVLLGAFVSAMAIKEIFEKRLYYALGCQSQEDYIETKLPFSHSQCYKLVAVARRFETVTDSLQNKNLLAEGSSDELNMSQSTVQKISSLGIEKLYSLSKVESDELDELLKSGKIKLNGKVLSLDDLKDMTAKEVATQIKKATGKYQEKLKKIETENIQLREENKLLENEKEHLLTENKTAKEIEMQYGPAATQTKHKRELLNFARQYLNSFDAAIHKAAITEEDPQGLQKDLVDMIAKVDEVHSRLIDVYGIITTRF